MIYSSKQAVRMFRELEKSYKIWIADHQRRIEHNDEPNDIIGIYLKAMQEKKASKEKTYCSGMK